VASQLETYRQQFEDIADQAKRLAADLTEAEFNQRPAPGEWCIEECLSHLIAVGSVQVEVIEQAISKAHAKGLKGKGPFEYSAFERMIIRESDTPVRHAMRAPKRFQPLHGQPVTAVLPTFLHIQRQLSLQVERCTELDLRKVKVATPVSRFLKFSLGGTFEVVAAHERRHVAQAGRVRERIKPLAGAHGG
jgi:hypothetical protein